MASKTNTTPRKEEVPNKEGPETPPDSPLLDLSDAAVKKLIRSAKKRGYVTHDQINTLLSSEEVKSEQIEDILAMLSEMGVNVVETEDTEPEEEAAAREEPEEEAESEGGEIAEVQHKVPAKTEAKERAERTDDPIRMYLREMGSVELLSREGERDPVQGPAAPRLRPREWRGKARGRAGNRLRRRRYGGLALARRHRG